MSSEATKGSRVAFSELLRERQAEILSYWDEASKQLPPGSLDPSALTDHVPVLLARVADIADDLTAGRTPSEPTSQAEGHALERLDEGLDLDVVVLAHTLLRGAILNLWEREGGGARPGLVIVDRAIDRALAASVERFTSARERTLGALERAAAAPLVDLDAFLGELLRAFVETTANADTAAVLIRQGELLRLRAAVGMDEELACGATVAVGTGPLGLVAARGEPLDLRAAASEPHLGSPSLRRLAVRALHVVPLFNSGEVVGVAHLGSVTAHAFSAQDRRLFRALAQHAERAVAQHALLAEVVAARQARDQALESRRNLLSRICHDLRSPLGVVLMQSDAMLRDPAVAPNTPARRRTIAIQRSSEAIARLIDDVDAVAAVEAHELSLEPQPESPVSLVSETVEAFRPLAEARGITLDGDAAPDLPAYVVCDQRRVLQVLARLVSNALGVIPSAGRVVVHAHHDNGRVVFRVNGSAAGLPAAELPGLLDAIGRSPGGPARGAGLGLVAARGIIEAHGGELHLIEDDAGGSITFTLPSTQGAAV